MSRFVKWKLRKKYSRLFRRTALQFTQTERPQQEENLKEQTKNESKKRLLKDPIEDKRTKKN